VDGSTPSNDSKVYRLQVSQDPFTWLEPIVSSVAENRYGSAALYFAEQFILLGGLNTTGQPSSDAFIFELASQEWRKMAAERFALSPFSILPTPRLGATLGLMLTPSHASIGVLYGTVCT
jgi:hypothetical protein